MAGILFTWMHTYMCGVEEAILVTGLAIQFYYNTKKFMINVVQFGRPHRTWVTYVLTYFSESFTEVYRKQSITRQLFYSCNSLSNLPTSTKLLRPVTVFIYLLSNISFFYLSSVIRFPHSAMQITCLCHPHPQIVPFSFTRSSSHSRLSHEIFRMREALCGPIYHDP
jgi:hypothetical protein